MKPNVGMLYPVAAEVNSYVRGTGLTYKTPFIVSEARGATLNWEGNDGEFYGDNTLLDVDKGIIGYTLDFEPAGLKSDVRAKLLGEKTTTGSNSYKVTGANPPDLGFGFVKEMREDDNGAVKTTFEGWFFYKIKFRINSEEARTKERNLEWRVPTMNGTGSGVYLDDGDDPVFAIHEDFDDLDDAKEWVMDRFENATNEDAVETDPAETDPAETNTTTP